MIDKVGTKYGALVGAIDWGQWLQWADAKNNQQIETNKARLHIDETDPDIVRIRGTSGVQARGDLIASLLQTRTS